MKSCARHAMLPTIVFSANTAGVGLTSKPVSCSATTVSTPWGARCAMPAGDLLDGVGNRGGRAVHDGRPERSERDPPALDRFGDHHAVHPVLPQREPSPIPIGPAPRTRTDWPRRTSLRRTACHDVAIGSVAWALRMRAVNRRYEAAVEAIVASGIAEGTLRPLSEPRVLAYGLMGVVSWTHRWFNPHRSPVDAAAIGDAYAEVLLGGMVRPEDPVNIPVDGVTAST